MLSKSFDHAAAEPALYAGWEAQAAFHADPDSPAAPYTIMIPRPTSPAASTWATPSP